MQRRDFVKAGVVGTLASTALLEGAAARAPLPRRPYRDEWQLSIIGFGGIVVVGQEQATANRTVANAMDAGINYYDVAPSYGNGEAEEKLGPALEPFRKDVFLACKTTQRKAEGAQREMEQSLRRLRTDHFDLYQFHSVSSMEDVETILGPGGAAEYFLKARQQGKFRYLGFSAHNAEAAIALMDRLPMESILFPVNFVNYQQGNFGPQILEHARRKGISRLALKAMAYTRWPNGLPREKRSHPKCWYQPAPDREIANQGLRFTLSEDVTAAIPPGDHQLFELAVELARDFKPLQAGERQQILASSNNVEPIFRA